VSGAMKKKPPRPRMPVDPFARLAGPGNASHNGLLAQTTEQLLATPPALRSLPEPDWGRLRRLLPELLRLIDILAGLEPQAPRAVRQLVRTAAAIAADVHSETTDFLRQAGAFESGSGAGLARRKASGLTVKAGGLPIFIEDKFVSEVVRISDINTVRARDRQFVCHRGKMIEVFALAELLAAKAAAAPPGQAKIMLFASARGIPVALLADELTGRESIVYTALPAYLGAMPGVAGAAVRSGGEVLLVIDLECLFKEEACI